ncbi:MAG: asparagine synthase-related protein [Verrucomicrobiales bacterium]
MPRIWLPPCTTRRHKYIFRAPFAATFFAKPPPFVRQLVSPESLAKTGYFDAKTVGKHFQDYLDQPDKRRRNLVVEMALSTVMTTQLWHHIYIDGSLCESPAWAPPPHAPSHDPPLLS